MQLQQRGGSPAVRLQPALHLVLVLVLRLCLR